MTNQIHLFRYAEFKSFTFKMVRAKDQWMCDKCKKKISAGVLYLWSQTQQRYGDGVRLHLECADKLTCTKQATLPNWGQKGKLVIE